MPQVSTKANSVVCHQQISKAHPQHATGAQKRVKLAHSVPHVSERNVPYAKEHWKTDRLPHAKVTKEKYLKDRLLVHVERVEEIKTQWRGVWNQTKQSHSVRMSV